MASSRGRGRLASCVAPIALLTATLSAQIAQAQSRVTTPPPSDGLSELRGVIQAQDSRLQRDEALIAEQARVLEQQRKALATQQLALEHLLDTRELETVRAAGADGEHADTPAGSVIASATPQNQSSPPTVQPVGPVGPVGEAPAPEPLRQVALPEFINVLTPPGHLTVDTALSYEQNSSNRLVYRGVEIVPGIQIGLVEANNASSNSAIATAIARYGVFRRFEIEVLAPYVYRSDRIETLSQRDQTISQAQQLRGSGLGDVEVTGRYQITGGVNGWPILIANLRFKSDSGKGPFDVSYDQFGVASNLAVGSGFLGVEPSLSAIYTSDPVVLFGNISYLNNFSRNINKTINNALVGTVDPGNSIGASAGFAFSVNPNFSFTLGYKHNFIERTTTELGGTLQKSTSLQIGSLLFGWAYRINNRLSLVSNLEVGVTGDAPNVILTVRVPLTF